MGRKERMKTELGPALCAEGCQGCIGTVRAIRALEPTLARLSDDDRVTLANFMHDVAHATVDVMKSVFSVVSTTKHLYSILKTAPVIVDEDEPVVVH